MDTRVLLPTVLLAKLALWLNVTAEPSDPTRPDSEPPEITAVVVPS